MKVINIHNRVINQPIAKIAELLDTLATDNDMMVATHKWPAMKLDNGKKPGSKGGHGSIGYFVEQYSPGNFIQFRFTKPEGFNGYHKFKIADLGDNKTELHHIIDMRTTGSAMFKWMVVIRWLHDAYIEDAFDKVENHFLERKKKSNWSFWVRLLRRVLKGKKVK